MDIARAARRRGAIVLLVIGGVLATAFASAAIGSPGAANADPQVAALKKQVKILQTQVKALRKQDDEQWSEIGAGWASQDCLAAQIADLIQGTWSVIDELGRAQPAPSTYFGPQTQVPDYRSCEDISQYADPAVPRGAIQVPPKIDPLLPLLKWIHG